MFEFAKRWLDSLEFDFVRLRYIAATVSTIMVVGSWAVFAVIGPNWGIDFTGGTEIHLRFTESTSITEVRGALKTLGLSDDAVQSVNGSGSNEFVVRIQDASFGMEELVTEFEAAVVELFPDVDGQPWAETIDATAEVSARFDVKYRGEIVAHQTAAKLMKTKFPGANAVPGTDANTLVFDVPGLAQRIKKRIDEAVGGREFDVLSTDSVGPKVGGELRRQSAIAIGATLGFVLLYVAFRFDIGFAPGAIIALFHDVSITVGIFVLLQLEFNLPMIGALLTIVGYSLNDTIVIYDRIRENRDRYRRTDLKGLINTSINETLARTVATSVTTMMAITLFLVLGGPVIRNFALAMALGIIFGTYSTVFVASPMILWMEDVKPYLAKLVVTTDGGDDNAAPEGPMTASEKRRRERAGIDPEAASEEG